LTFVRLLNNFEYHHSSQEVNTPLGNHTVLVVKIKNTSLWESGKPTLLQQINGQVDAAFNDGGTYSHVYWIGVIGPHQQYGIKEDTSGKTYI
jgi:hypothetical protein